MRVTVKVENLKIYAYHGCMKEEEVIGSDYIVKDGDIMHFRFNV